MSDDTSTRQTDSEHDQAVEKIVDIATREIKRICNLSGRPLTLEEVNRQVADEIESNKLPTDERERG